MQVCSFDFDAAARRLFFADQCRTSDFGRVSWRVGAVHRNAIVVADGTEESSEAFVGMYGAETEPKRIERPAVRRCRAGL